MFEELSSAEQRAVSAHQQRLSIEKGHDVPLATALSDWLENCAQAWRTERQACILELQRQEIMRHKWIESEKARRDLGSDAVLDWIQKHAARWREWYEREYEMNKV